MRALSQPHEMMKPELSGLQKLCKLYGRMKCGDTMMAWDYANDCAVKESVLRADKERWIKSEQAKWNQLRPDKK